MGCVLVMSCCYEYESSVVGSTDKCIVVNGVCLGPSGRGTPPGCTAYCSVEPCESDVCSLVECEEYVYSCGWCSTYKCYSCVVSVVSVDVGYVVVLVTVV